MRTIKNLMSLVAMVTLISWCCATAPAAFAAEELTARLQAVLEKGP